ncbi:MAG: hypothetical protein IJ244_00330 [Bacteroidaceae bacterium]|nr:hypothetical protein [Bacteroidaceae bacterium]
MVSFQIDQIIVDNKLTNAGSSRLERYLCHALCYEGHGTFDFNNNHYRFEAGNCLIVRRGDMLENIWQSADFRVDVIYVTPEFITISTPLSNYWTNGSLALFNDPIIWLTPEQQKVCALDFDYIKRRLALTTYHFHRDATVIYLPDQDIHGNSHFMFQEKNNAQIADLVMAWIEKLSLN